MLGVLVGWEAAAVDELALEARDPRLGDRVVECVSLRADRRRDPELVEAVGIGEARILRAAVAMGDQPWLWLTQGTCHLERVEDNFGA